MAPEVLDLCDQNGILVWEENRFVTAGVQPDDAATGASSETSDTALPHVGSAEHTTRRDVLDAQGGRARWAPPTTTIADPRLLQDAQDMVLRDRNHPSIVIWSLCNELGCVADDPNGGILAAQFKFAISVADPTRPITGNTVQTPYLSGRLVDSFAQYVVFPAVVNRFSQLTRSFLQRLANVFGLTRTVAGRWTSSPSRTTTIRTPVSTSGLRGSRSAVASPARVSLIEVGTLLSLNRCSA